MIVRHIAARSFVCTFVFIGICVLAVSSHAQAPAPAAVVSASSTASIGKVDVSPRSDGLTISITVSSPIVPKAMKLSSPDRLVFDFPGCDLKVAGHQIPINRGSIKDLRLSLFSVHPPVTRVVVDSDDPLKFEIKPAENGVVLIEIPFQKTAAGSSNPAPSNSAPSPAKTTSPPTPSVQAPAAAPKPEPPPPVRPPAHVPAIEEKVHSSAAVEKDLATPVLAPPKSPEPQTTARPPREQQGAYALMAKARGLSVGDLQTLEEKADAGDPEGETMLALAYHAGVLLKQNDAESLRLLHKAADRGYMAAEESLGIFSEAGVGVDQPAYADALQWYSKAAQQGSLDAATNMALMYANGRGVARDVNQAATWFRRAADGGDPSAQYNLALMYQRGEGAPQDFKESIRWLSAAADQNLVPAIIDLGEIYLKPPNSTITADIARSVQYFQKAADLGSEQADAILGTIYTRGMQGKVDYDEAVRYFRKAADLGSPDGELGLGVSYALGHGVPVDLDEARRLLTLAAGKGQVEAQYDLGILLEEGKGAPADRDQAAHYYEMAANEGMSKAQYRYGLLLAKGSDSRTSRVAAYKWLMLAQDSVQESSAALNDVRKSMSAPEIAEAEQAVDSWRLSHRHARQ